MFLKTPKQRKHISSFKEDISDFIVYLKKKYKLYPWRMIDKVSKRKINSSIIITIDKTKYTVNDLIKEIKNKKNNIESKIKPSYYNKIIISYIKDSNKKSDEEVDNIYKEYKEELANIKRETKDELVFCLTALKELNSSFRKKPIKESEEIKMSNIDVKLALYEACSDGLITFEEREEMLKEYNERTFVESEIESASDSGLSAKEIYNNVKKALYEACSDGEISIDKREELLVKAKGMIFNEAGAMDGLKDLGNKIVGGIQGGLDKMTGKSSSQNSMQANGTAGSDIDDTNSKHGNEIEQSMKNTPAAKSNTTPSAFTTSNNSIPK